MDTGGEVTMGTYIPFENLAGDMLMSVYVMKACWNRDKEELVGPVWLSPYSMRESRSRYRYPRFILYTTSSYVTKETWRVIMNVFASQMEQHYPGLESVVAMPNLTWC